LDIGSELASEELKGWGLRWGIFFIFFIIILFLVLSNFIYQTEYITYPFVISKNKNIYTYILDSNIEFIESKVTQADIVDSGQVLFILKNNNDIYEYLSPLNAQIESIVTESEKIKYISFVKEQLSAKIIIEDQNLLNTFRNKDFKILLELPIDKAPVTVHQSKIDINIQDNFLLINFNEPILDEKLQTVLIENGISGNITFPFKANSLFEKIFHNIIKILR
jgi:hypothetical protein